MRWVFALLLVAVPAQAGTRQERPLPPQEIAFWSVQDGLLVSSAVRQGASPTTISVTHDGGRTWRVVRHLSASASVSAVAGTGTAFATTSRGLLQTHDSGATWSRIFPGILWQPSFVSTRVGWAVGGVPFERERILSTHDGGRSWRVLRGPCGSETTIEVSLASATRGWVVCSSQPGAGQQPKEVWSTRDGGGSWRLVNRASPFSKAVGHGLCVCGYAAGIELTAGGAGWLWMARGSFYSTHDGGRSWTSLPISAPEVVEGRSAALLTSRVGYALFGHRPALRFTRDGGRTWTVVRRWSQ
ncbi:MAG: hypothetical protein QOF45_2627 [Gaiellaceae bacterium]|jgi:photosystem II stability/assembly factor-like uncharacterized protein|nr:hypothetical protein [Gaiellaceae bacterium]